MTRADIMRFIHAVRDSDDDAVDDAVTRLSRVRPWLAPLTFAVGLTLEAGATGAVKAVRMSAKLVSGRNPAGRRGATRFPEG